MSNNKNRSLKTTLYISCDTLSSQVSVHDQLSIQVLQRHGCITNV